MAGVPDATVVFGAALKDFKDNLSDEDKTSFSVTTMDDLNEAITKIQAEQASTRTLKNMTRLKAFLEAMQTYAKVLDLFVNVHNFVAFIWVGPSGTLSNRPCILT